MNAGREMPIAPRSIESFVVTAEQMRQIEGRVFAAGMPVAALMEKVAGLMTQRIVGLYPQSQQVGILVGPGHNGGDALVVARELHLRGYGVRVYAPFPRLKDLTAAHAQYCQSLGIPWVKVTDLQSCDLLIDGLFGFGLERPLDGEIAAAIDRINQWPMPIVSIDLPSGLHTDTGQVMGKAIRATHTLCLGLWKQGLLQDHALAWVGEADLIDFGLPCADIQAILTPTPAVNRITTAWACSQLPLDRPAATHKYKMGHGLLIVGSRQYAGAAILAGLGARATGLGMLSIAVPTSLKPLVLAQLPDALIIDCPETERGAIARLPDGMNWQTYSAIGFGCGLTTEIESLLPEVLLSQRPLVLDADGLNVLAQLGTRTGLANRSAPTILTPHEGEFRRLFPDLTMDCRLTAVQMAAQSASAIVLLKGARVMISDGQTTWINPDSSAALARGGSGDVLTGLTLGLLAQQGLNSPIATVAAAAWWHAQAGIWAARDRTVMGVDAQTLTQALIPALRQIRG